MTRYGGHMGEVGRAHVLTYSKLLTGLLTGILRESYGTLRNTWIFTLRVTLRDCLRLPYGTLTGPYGTQLSQNRAVTGW